MLFPFCSSPSPSNCLPLCFLPLYTLPLCANLFLALVASSLEPSAQLPQDKGGHGQWSHWSSLLPLVSHRQVASGGAHSSGTAASLQRGGRCHDSPHDLLGGHGSRHGPLSVLVCKNYRRSIKDAQSRQKGLVMYVQSAVLALYNSVIYQSSDFEFNYYRMLCNISLYSYRVICMLLPCFACKNYYVKVL